MNTDQYRNLIAGPEKDFIGTDLSILDAPNSLAPVISLKVIRERKRTRPAATIRSAATGMAET